ncbi:MAG TPA: LacI family DNA-binding transcriptional regulator [Ornithinibacter sp.]|nr:LacI family DNA-binding transcriptional regulator [Ornithinibacter sp.]
MATGGPASGRARLVDVAHRAGVSTATVSLVLRGRPGPSRATADAVRAAAEELGYRPDRTASLLARHRTHLLGVLLDVSSPFHAELVRALDSASADRGLDLVLGTTTPRTGEHRAAETLLDFRCEALVLLGPQMGDADLSALAATCPTVAVGRTGAAGVTGVLAADDQGLEEAVDHLASLGHRRIAFVDGPRGSIARARRRGYRDAMARHGFGSGADVVRGGAAEADGSAAALQLLSRPAGARPTAVIAFNDRVAIGLRDGLLRSGVGVPEEISVVGYDDSPMARLGTIDLTSVSQEPDALAHATVAVVATLLDGAPGQRVPDVVIAPRLVVRSSTGPPPGRR